MKPPPLRTTEPPTFLASGSADSVKLAAAWSQNPDPAAAGEEATENAIEALACPARGLVFYTYYEKAGFEPEDETQVSPDPEAEQVAAKAVAEAAAAIQAPPVPSIGCRARPLTNGGTLLQNAVAVLAIGGEQASCAAAAVPILDNRREIGETVAQALRGVDDLSIIVALAEPRLSFEAKEGVSVEDFIRGVLDTAAAGTTLFGGNSMNTPDAGMAGAQFHDGEALTGHVVAMGIGGPLEVFSNHTNEFQPSEQTVTVTEARDKWVIELDGEPAADVYRRLRGMAAEEEFTSDWQHPVGVVVSPDKVYLRMILNWTDEQGKDKDGKATDLAAGSLLFVAPIPEGTEIKVLKGGDDAQAILASAKDGLAEVIAEAQDADAQPALALISDCCARGMRLRQARRGREDEVTDAIVRAMPAEFPIFGFYAYGELGRIRGEYQGMDHQYQQHTFVSALLALR